MKMNLDQDFKEFIELLNRNQVKYLVIGGYAVSFHGHPRYTKDIDFWIEMDDANADRTLRALDEFGFGGVGITKTDLLTPDRILQLGFPPQRIDIITTPPGVSFSQCFERRVLGTVDGVEILFIDRENLIVNKTASGRPQDLADVDHLSES